MTEQMSKIVAAAKTAEWGGKHGSLALVLDKDEYRTTTRYAGKKIERLAKTEPVKK